MKKSLQLVVLLAAVMVVPAALAQEPGAVIYKAKCAMCHGPDGKAATPVAKMMHVPSFEASKNKPNAILVAIIENGKEKMPAYNGKLSSQQIKDVIAYIRTLDKK